MKRTLTGIALAIPVVWLILAAHPYLFLAVTALTGIVCLREFHRLAGEHGLPVAVLVAAIAGAAMICIPRLDAAWLALPLLAAMMLALRGALRDVLLAAGGFAAALLYCFAPWRCAVLLREINPYWLLFALALNWVGDIAAFVMGSRFGRHKLAPAISPGKSWEGSAASVAASVLFGLLYVGYFIPGQHPLTVAAMSAVANVAGQLGDLCESAMKRGAGLKDSGSLLPGHGGLLDRVDSSLFAVPVVYAWLSFA